MVKSNLGSAKRFGTRYGKSTKSKVAKVEAVQRSKQKCPACMKMKAKRVASGIFVCDGCGAKFTGKSYAVCN